VNLAWTDDSLVANWVTIQRSQDNFKTVDKSVNVVQAECTNQSGCARTYTDTNTPSTAVSYRVMANNTVGAGDGKLDAPRAADGSYGDYLPAELSALTPGFTGYSNVTANSNWSNVATRAAIPVGLATVTPGSITFPDTVMGATNPTTAAGRQVITIQNTGTALLSISGISINGAAFVRGTSTTTTAAAYRGSCSTAASFTLAAGASCTYNVMFKPTATACTGAITGNAKACTATLTVTSNSDGITGTRKTVSLTGNGILQIPQAGLSSNTLSFASTNVGATSAAQLLTLSNNGNAALAVSSLSFPTGFVRSGGTCATTATFNVAAGANCTIGAAFKPTVAGPTSGNLVITDNAGGVTGTTQIVTLTGTGAGTGSVTANPDTLTAIANTTTTQQVTVNVRANDVPANAGTVAVVSMSKTASAGATATVNANNSIVLTMTGVGGTTAARQSSKRGVYTITYRLTNNGVTVQSTATVTVN